MQIIIPMSGSGQRFVNAGYTDLKPLIQVDDESMIYHVIKLFPNETNITFVCNNIHFKTTHVYNILKSIV